MASTFMLEYVMPSHQADGLIILTSEELLNFEALMKRVRLYINGEKCTSANVFGLMLEAPVGQTSVNSSSSMRAT